jgi:hypothetical protein
MAWNGAYPPNWTQAERDAFDAEYAIIERACNPRRTTGERLNMLRAGRSRTARQEFLVRIPSETRRVV